MVGVGQRRHFVSPLVRGLQVVVDVPARYLPHVVARETNPLTQERSIVL